LIHRKLSILKNSPISLLPELPPKAKQNTQSVSLGSLVPTSKKEADPLHRILMIAHGDIVWKITTLSNDIPKGFCIIAMN
jgi:hypothetical protein